MAGNPDLILSRHAGRGSGTGAESALQSTTNITTIAVVVASGSNKRSIENMLISASNGVDVPVVSEVSICEIHALEIKLEGLPTILSLYVNCHH